jgi:hypothetical protein
MDDLNEQQVDVIVTEALQAGYFERGPDGQLPDADGLKEAAIELVRQCRLAHQAGTRSDGVQTILFAAEANLEPSTSTSTQGAQSVSSTEDITKYPNELLLKLEETLMGYPESDEVTQNLALIRTEISNRPNLASKAPQQNGGEVAPVQETLAQEVPAQETQIAADPSVRKALEDRLTFGIMRAHGIDPSDVPELSDDQLQWAIDHPNTVEAQDPEDNAPSEVAPSPSMPEAQGETIMTTRMVIHQPEQEPPQPPQPSVPTVSPSSVISSERIALEEQVTGPMVKAFGRGRNDVSDGSIGDNELRFMIEHPDGKVTQESLFAARALDQGAPASVPQEEAVAEAEQQSEIDVQEAVDAFTPKPVEPKQKAKPAPKMAPQEVVASPPSPPVQSAPLSQDLPQNPAQDIIDREKFPIPAEIEETVRLPFDLSKLSDPEIRSHHSRAHAIHSRMNYVVGLWQSELSDEVKLRKGREVQVMNSLPAKDGRKSYTDAQREAMVQADEIVISHRDREHGIEKILRQITTLQGNYASDVKTCSRQLSQRDEERSGSR